MPTPATILPPALPGPGAFARASVAAARVPAGTGSIGVAPASGRRGARGSSTRYPVNLNVGA